jgi:hypothetical protein
MMIQLKIKQKSYIKSK